MKKWLFALFLLASSSGAFASPFALANQPPLRLMPTPVAQLDAISVPGLALFKGAFVGQLTPVGLSSLPGQTPQDFGAACDGSTLDDANLQNWMNQIGITINGVIPFGSNCIHYVNLLLGGSPAKTSGVCGFIFAYGGKISAQPGTVADGQHAGIIAGTDYTHGCHDGGIYGLTYDGQRQLRTVTQPNCPCGAGIYASGVSNFVLEENHVYNSPGDNIYIGGYDGVGNGRANNVWVIRNDARWAYRNNLSVVGLYTAYFMQNKWFGAGCFTGCAAPMAGADYEPDSSLSMNQDIEIVGDQYVGNYGDGLKFSENGQWIYRIRAWGVHALANDGYGINSNIDASWTDSLYLYGTTAYANNSGGADLGGTASNFVKLP